MQTNFLFRLYGKYKFFVFYGIFGALTTLVNVLVYWLCAHGMRLAVVPSATVAWLIAMLFAYITNRKWVFYSTVTDPAKIAYEMISFFSSRLATGLVDITLMAVFVNLLHFNDLIVKIAANIIVIVLNYLASRFLIFRHTRLP
ncbi:MAG: GtrA family protein [Elusimicrobiaceae bacterium]|nr:GtrA family protein [Elusimicrobiaceae bacterium]